MPAKPENLVSPDGVVLDAPIAEVSDLMSLPSGANHRGDRCLDLLSGRVACRETTS